MTRRALLLACFLSALGCESVPTLTFVTPEAVPDGAPSDGDVEAGCPGGSSSDGASACCGAIPCTGDCTPVNCATCNCTAPGTFCCAHSHNVVCRQNGSVCN